VLVWSRESDAARLGEGKTHLSCDSLTRKGITMFEETVTESPRQSGAKTERVYAQKKDCCGCGACMNICPTGAITMECDSDGFFFPRVNQKLCENCGLCRQVCAFRSGRLSRHEPLAVFAAVNRDRRVLASSASSGVFAALASLVFEDGGVVFGCAYSSDMRPRHVCVEDPGDLRKLQGSKYVQSDIDMSYAEARRYLDEGRRVLFTGTPCQIVGLRSYLGKEHENLVTADLICHGVPSTGLFRDYIKYLEQQLGGTVVDFRFRDKSRGWGILAMVAYKSNSTLLQRILPPTSFSYYWYFLQDYTLRESCYECVYANTSRPGDFTMGDYWGIERAHPDIDPRNGVSVLLVNSEKGMTLIDRLSQFLQLTESNLEKALACNPRLRQPPQMTARRMTIFRAYREGGYQALEHYFENEMRRQRVLARLKALAPRPIKWAARKLLGR